MASFYSRFQKKREDRDDQVRRMYNAPETHWRDADYSREFWRDKVGDKLKLVKNIVVRSTPQFMFKNSKTNDIMVMESAQKIMDQIAVDLKLKNIFSPENAVINGVTNALAQQAGVGNPEAAAQLGEVSQAVESAVQQGTPASGEEAEAERSLGEDLAAMFDTSAFESNDVTDGELRNHYKVDSHELAKKKYAGYTARDRRDASAIRHEQREKSNLTAQDILGYGDLFTGLGGTAVGVGIPTLTDMALGEATDAAKDWRVGAGSTGAGLNLAADLMAVTKRGLDTADNWAGQDKRDRLESLAGFATDVGRFTGHSMTMASAIKQDPELKTWGFVASNAGEALSNTIGIFTNQSHVNELREHEKATKATKTFHKKEGQTSIQAAQSAQKMKGAEAFQRYLASNPGDVEGAKRAADDAIASEGKTQAQYVRKRNSEHMAKSMRTDKRNRAAIGLAGNLLAGGTYALSALLGPKTLGGKIAGYVAMGLGTGTKLIGGLVADLLQGKSQVKTVDNEIRAIKLNGGEMAAALADIENYDDLKKRFKFEYAKRTKNESPRVRNISDADFKTLMSNALSGQSGGKAGIANAIAMGRAKELADGGEADEGLLSGMGVRRQEDGRLPSREFLAQRLGKVGPGYGQYTSHQFAPGV